MVQTKTRSKVIKALAKGQVTIPSEFREMLGIDARTLLVVSVVGDHLEIAPLNPGQETLRRYTEKEIARFLEEDKLDESTARRIREMLRSGAL